MGSGEGKLVEQYPNLIKTILNGYYPVDFTFGLTKPAPSESLSFEDALIQASFVLSRTEITFSLKNKSDGPVKIDWNQWSYVDFNSKSHKIIHGGIKFYKREETQAPTVVPPTASVDDVIVPSDAVIDSAAYSGFEQLDFLPGGPAAVGFVGKSISLFMPMEINGVVKNYLFTFTVKNVQKAQ